MFYCYIQLYFHMQYVKWKYLSLNFPIEFCYDIDIFSFYLMINSFLFIKYNFLINYTIAYFLLIFFIKYKLLSITFIFYYNKYGNSISIACCLMNFILLFVICYFYWLFVIFISNWLFFFFFYFNFYLYFYFYFICTFYFYLFFLKSYLFIYFFIYCIIYFSISIFNRFIFQLSVYFYSN